MKKILISVLVVVVALSGCKYERFSSDEMEGILGVYHWRKVIDIYPQGTHISRSLDEVSFSSHTLRIRKKGYMEWYIDGELIKTDRVLRASEKVGNVEWKIFIEGREQPIRLDYYESGLGLVMLYNPVLPGLDASLETRYFFDRL